MTYSQRPDKLIIIPAYNEELNIARTISQIPKTIDIVVVNDGSTDKTEELIRLFPVNSINHPKNLGYERAVETGIKYFIEKNYTRFVVLDADGEINVKDAINLLEQVCEENIVICGYHTQNQGRLSERISAKFSNKLFGIRDIFCGCKAFHVNALRGVDISIIPQNAFTKFVAIQSKYTSIANYPVSGMQRSGNSAYGSGVVVELKLMKKFLSSVYAYYTN